MNKDTIYLIFTNNDTLLSKAIGVYTKREYNHVSIALDTNFNTVYSFGRKNFNNPFFAGFVEEDLHDQFFQEASCTIYSCNITLLQSVEIQKVINQFIRQKNLYKYNFLGLFGVMFGRSIPRANAYFCSQFVAYVLFKANVIHLDKPLELTTPQDIELISGLSCIYQGKVRSMFQTTMKSEG